MKFKIENMNIKKILAGIIFTLILHNGISSGNRQLNYHIIEKFIDNYEQIYNNIVKNSNKIELLILDETLSENDKKTLFNSLDLYSTTLNNIDYYKKLLKTDINLEKFMVTKRVIIAPDGTIRNYKRFKSMENLNIKLNELITKF
ncbi:MAG: hypothetical protein ACRC0G_15250 [Fusobacteriaceae bacterium]